MVATTTIGACHWQERFEPVDVEGAARRQILNVRRSIAYDHWLKQKTRSNKDSRALEAGCIDTDNQDKQAEIDAAFQDWLKRKRKSSKKKKTASNNSSEQPKPWRKPPSQHVNPKTKGTTRKPEQVNPNSESNPHRCRSEAESQQAYNAWLARVRLEDQIRRAQRRDELDRLEQQQREKHKVTWRKKLAVCAYSTLVVDN
ncbi:hypothetical protein PR003_g15741 [Phytophthora rubi]|uniref:Uncharacterized protein n=1 Tax=Phytophthora rubi TaxID=129364 RepID=A0A6A3NLZ2_9STRA|nr:hypothetical protein PR002_g2861 [Phytophthora rubi]KAE9049864.1 hypothetical protein PR001_g2911 [Phytophthora rubi]KAE9328622.1 hypothetical protein PR003_g15741 [Phytophthora rubi]